MYKGLSALLGTLAILLVSATSEAQNTITGPSQVIEFKVNSASFGGLIWAESPAPSHIARSVSYAANHWAAYGGSRRVYQYVGETSLTSGAPGEPYIIAANSGCYTPTDCTTLAVNTLGPYKSIVVYGGAGVNDYTLQLGKSTGSGTFPAHSLTSVLTHEFGHAELLGDGMDGKGHLPPPIYSSEDCLMAPSIGRKARGLCSLEILNLGRASAYQLTGPGYHNGYLGRSITPGPNPSVLNPLLLTALTTGVAGGVLTYGKDVFFPSNEWRLVARTPVSVNQASVPPVVLSPPDNAWTAQIANESVQRPVLVFDPTRNAWFMLVLEPWTSTRQNRVRLYKNVPGTSPWVDLGLLSHPTTNVESKYPPGLAFDFRTSNLVVVWNSSEGTNDSSSSTFGFGCNREYISLPNGSFPNWLRHCRNEILAGIITPDGNGSGHLLTAVQRFNSGAAPNFWGYAGVGSPSVVCDPQNFYPWNNCEVYVTNVSQWKEIVNWKFCTNGTGFCGFSAQYAERSSSPGETDFPIALASRRADGTGRIMEAVRGGDRNIWWRTKSDVFQSYPGWNGPYGPRAMAAPSIVRSLVEDTYSVLYPLE